VGVLHYLKRDKAVELHGEIGVDNFSSNDTDLTYFSLIRSIYLRYNVKSVLDYGAGRNVYEQDFDDNIGSYFIRDLRDLRYGGAEVTVADISPAVLSHPTSKYQHHLGLGDPLPFPDASFDLVVSDFVFEHLEYPEHVTSELLRVLKPGGWLLARTPNKYGYVAIIASLVPNRLHTAVLKWIQPDRKDVDVFPTYYRINRLSQMRKYFRNCETSVITNHWEPQYFFGRKWLYRVNEFIHALIPKSLGMTSIFIVRKTLSA
jgi:SAM-dependent methyltransferase